MKKNLGVKPYIMPMPVLIIGTYNEDGTPNAMNAAWGTLSDNNVVAICLEAAHKTVKNILNKKAFTVAVANEENLVSADYVGIVSGNKELNKMQKSGFTTTKSEFVDAPVINELSLTIECKLMGYDEQTGFVLGEILNTLADENVLNENGNVDLLKVKPISYDMASHGYFSIGKKVGQAFSDGKKLK